MAANGSYLGLTDFVEGLCLDLNKANFREDYEKPEDLGPDVLKIVRQFVTARLEPLRLSYKVIEGGAAEKPEPVYLFGTVFSPHITIEVGEFPTVALQLGLIRKGEDPGVQLACSLGQAFIFSRQYQAVVAFVLHRGRSDEHKHWLDREFQAELWTSHKIKFLLRR